MALPRRGRKTTNAVTSSPHSPDGVADDRDLGDAGVQLAARPRPRVGTR